MIEKFLLHLLFRENRRFLFQVGFCAVLWGEMNNKTFRGVESEPSDFSFLIRFFGC